MTQNTSRLSFEMNDRTNHVTDAIPSAIHTLKGLFQLAIVGVLIGVLLFQDTQVPASAVGLFVLLLLWLIGRLGAAPLLMAFQLVLFLREPGQSAPNDRWASYLFVMTVLGLVMFLGRDRLLRRITSQRLTDLFRSLFGRRDASRNPAPVEVVRTEEQGQMQTFDVVWRHAIVLVMSVLGAQFLITAFPLPGESAVGPRTLDEALQMLRPLPSLVVFVVAVVTLMSALAWRKLTTEQASMYMRSTQVVQHYSDLGMILRQRSKLRFTRDRRNSGSGNRSAEVGDVSMRTINSKANGN